MCRFRASHWFGAADREARRCAPRATLGTGATFTCCLVVIGTSALEAEGPSLTQYERWNGEVARLLTGVGRSTSTPTTARRWTSASGWAGGAGAIGPAIDARRCRYRAPAWPERGS